MREQGTIPAHLEVEVDGIGLIVADLTDHEWEVYTDKFYISVDADFPPLVEVEVYDFSAVENCYQAAKALHEKASKILTKDSTPYD